MKRILLIGNSPLPNENTLVRPAAGLRTNQFLQPLLKEAENSSYSILLVTIAMPDAYKEDVKTSRISHSKNFSHINISKDDPNLVRTIQQIHDEFRPDAIISVNTYPSYLAAQIVSKAPMWADLNGWIMAEAQAQAYKMNSNDYLGHYFQMEKTILKRGDKFSTVSDAQRYAVLGELAWAGRLNCKSFGYEFCHHIPNGIEWFEGNKVLEQGKRGAEGWGEALAGRQPDGHQPAERQSAGRQTDVLGRIPKNSFVLLWLGGYNTWVDENTLFKGVERAMQKCENLYFVSTGGEIAGLDNKTFAKFKEKIGASEFKERYIFLGWVDTKDIPYIYKRADAGINVDRKCAETFTGARNRINEMMKFGLPVVTTLGSEISYEVVRAGAGIGVGNGRAEDLAEAVSAIYKEWNGGGDRKTAKYKKYCENGRFYIENECSYAGTVEPLLKWLEIASPAPDRDASVRFGHGMSLCGGLCGDLRGALKYLKENGAKKFFLKLFQKIKN